MRDRGHASLEMALGAALLLIPVALAIASFGPWSERRVVAEAVAAEAARAAVLALDLGAGEEVVARVASNHSLAPDQVRLGWCGATPTTGSAGGCPMSRGTDVNATVQLFVPVVSTPWGAVGGLWVTGTHSEPVDLYRSLG